MPESRCVFLDADARRTVEGELSMDIFVIFIGNLICFLLGCLYSDWRNNS
jgi:hypothetical protein